MRLRSYVVKGAPTADKKSLDELITLLQAAVAVANTERWAVGLNADPSPITLPKPLRTAAYEVTVVDAFQRLIRHWVERQERISIWERPFYTGVPGAPQRVDIALFKAASAGSLGEEWRLELGGYSTAKLKKEARRIVGLPAEASYPSVRNLILLWNELPNRLDETGFRTWTAARASDAAAASALAGTPYASVDLLITSGLDLFVTGHKRHRSLMAAVFEVQ